MSAQLKTHLAVHGGGRTMIEKWLIGKHMFNFKFTVMQEPDLQRITFLGFKISKIFQNFKTIFGYYYLVKILKKFLYIWRMTNKFNWFYQPDLVGIRGDFCFQDGKSCISILHYAILFLLQKISSIPSLLFPVNSVWLHSLKGMNKFHFLRSLLQIRCS